MKRIQDVLGTGWEFYSEGQRLLTDSNAFRKKLCTKGLFDNWIVQVSKPSSHITGPIFDIQPNKHGDLVLSVNFDQKVIQIFKEVRHLQCMNFTIPHTIQSLALDAKRIYPYTISLAESIRVYNQVLSVLHDNPIIQTLTTIYHTQVRQLISKGLPMRWDYFINLSDLQSIEGGNNKYIGYIQDIQKKVDEFQEKVQIAQDTYADILSCLERMNLCCISRDCFLELLSSIQQKVILFFCVIDCDLRLIC